MRIGIVNDLSGIAELLKRIVGADPLNRVVWIARNGAEAVELCAKDTPDLILMDIVMPVMDGVESTRRIMAANPCAILIVINSDSSISILKDPASKSDRLINEVCAADG